MKKIMALILIVSLSGCSPTVDIEALWEELNIVFDEEKFILDNGSLFDPEAAIIETTGNVSFLEIEIDTSEAGNFEFVYTITNEKYTNVQKEVRVIYTVEEPLKLIMKWEVFYAHLNVDINPDVFVMEYSGVLTKPSHIDVSVEGSETIYTYSVSNRLGTETIEKEILVKVENMDPVIN